MPDSRVVQKAARDALGDFIEDKNGILPIDADTQSNLGETTMRVLASLIIAGELPPLATRLVREWTLARRVESEDNWRRARELMRRWRGFLAPMPTSDFPMVDVLRLRPLEGHRLWLRFTDGSEGVRDLSDVIAKGGVMVEPLKSKEYFDRVFVEMGAPTWPNGFDLDPALSRAAAE